MIWIHELQLHNVLFELDSKMVVDGINHTQVNETKFGAIILK